MNSDKLEAMVILRQAEQFERAIIAIPQNQLRDQTIADHWNSLLERTKHLFGNDNGPLSRSVLHLSVRHDYDGLQEANYHYIRTALPLLKGSLLAFFDLLES